MIFDISKIFQCRKRRKEEGRNVRKKEERKEEKEKMEGKEFFFEIFTQIEEYYPLEYRVTNYPGAQSSEILKIHTSIHARQPAV